MELPPANQPAPIAWQPFTFAGVASFAVARALWLWLVALTVAGLWIWAADSYVRVAWFPAIDRAIDRLPAEGEIRAGALTWPTNVVLNLADTGFLSLVVNPQSGPVPGLGADIAVEFTQRTLTAQSLFGYWVLSYPDRFELPLSRSKLEPVWAAWRPHVRLAVPIGLVATQVAFWVVVSLVLAPFLALAAAVLRREVTLGGCWRMALAAGLAGASIMAVGLLLYATRGFRLFDFLVTVALALAYALALTCGAPFRLPRRGKPSPFAGTSETGEAPISGSLVEPEAQAPTPSLSRPPRSPFAEPAAAPPVQNPFAPSADPATEPTVEAQQTSSPSLPPPSADHSVPPSKSPSVAEPRGADSGEEDGPLNPS